MNFRNFVWLFIVSLSIFVNSFAQTAPTEAATENEKKRQSLENSALQMADQAAAATDALKLPHNRVWVLAMAGDLY